MESKPDRSEQWLLGGDCSVCRRHKYCSKPCKPRQLYEQRRTASIIANAMMRAMINGTRKE